MPTPEVPPTDANGGPLRTAKSERTKTALVAVAREVFEKRGYQETRVADIVKAAGTGHGTFYRYFKSKEDLFRALSDLVRDGLVKAQLPPRPREPSTEPATREDAAEVESDIRAAMVSYLEDFRKDARLIEILDEVAVSDPAVRQARVEVLDTLARETTEALRYLVDRGICSSQLDVEYTALLIRSMVDRFAYTWFVHGEAYDERRAIDALVAAWKHLAMWIEPSALDSPEPSPSAQSPTREQATASSTKRGTAPAAPGRQVAARKSRSAATR
ncbi:MAG: helix-turn-helix domain-containing protein [Ilumatobacteraceae bacterium]